MPNSQRTILVTGASRGIGAEVAVRLAGADRHVVVNYRDKARRADEIVERIRDAGGTAVSVRADLCDESAVTAMLSTIGRLDVLVLNASGGMERGADPGYAMRINRDAQAALARRALEAMPAGGRIVFVTSHQAHFHDTKPVPAEYEAVAASKHAGERALKNMRAVLERHGVELVVVSGDMIEGTFVVRLLDRCNPDAVARRRAAGPLPTIEEFAGAIVDAVEAPGLDGHTVYVGGADYLGRV
ncbi:SDR family oxidoreductase [Mycolicibacterium iranicum]|uniref:3-oxoacyl-[acyl-carrier-protein] reductase MabA n=1 Tax=Mycolicibacterium iranicum TaxID=912594 RepID=A0A1X1WFP6_MYCIR|nr:SDR family oxidoreductase [Mycolicibacterium iranicum]ORV85445.1 short-chain dehydrogenase [Mycolicibacterium iranicum]